jgi:nitrogenase molybdenum-cofactor synthesis protein NifE
MGTGKERNAMRRDIFQLSIDALGNTGENWRNRIMPPESLHFCPASAGGWGIIRVGLLVPESGLLFVAPAGCGRHGAIAGIQCGFKKHLSFLYVSEMDIVTGLHMEKVAEAVAEILESVDPGLKALHICATCIDTLLVSDYESLAVELEAKHGIPVRICHMNPITMDGKTPPPLTVQQSVYDFLMPSDMREKAVNMIGGFAPVMESSEFHKIIADAGLGEVRHIAACSSFEQFLKMSRSSYNLLIRPGGRLAVQEMQKKLGIPYFSMPHSFGLETISALYRDLSEFLGTELDVVRYRQGAVETVRKYQEKLGDLSIAVALTEYGFHVPYIFADVVMNTDKEHVAWLRENAPDITLYTNVHPSMVDFLERKVTVDLAIGFDAGYYCSGAKTVPLRFDEQPFGFSAIEYLFTEMENALVETRSLKEQMYSSGLVI